MIKQKLLSPFQKFAKVESLSGILLLGATVIALLWANSAFSDTYHSLWQFKIGISSRHFTFSKPLILWINDGLMAIFFFLIGLEIKRELLIGELDSLQKAALPLFAAIGGMVVPFLFFVLLNRDPVSESGWGIPMATDIAFTLAILKALGDRVPLSLKVFLTAFAIVDDLGAVVVIAMFYSHGLHVVMILVALALLCILGFLAYRGIYIRAVTYIIGAVIWVLFLKSGIHPTIAGVLLAFTVPIRHQLDVGKFKERLSQLAGRLSKSPVNKNFILSREQMEIVDHLEDLSEEVRSPLQHLEHRLHYWVAYFIIPLFALANAGVTFDAGMQLRSTLALHIAIALFAGKGIGITLVSLLAIKTGLATLPKGAGVIHIIGIAVLAGVGFTMSVFITNLAFAGNAVLIDSAKVGVMAGSVVSAIAGFLILRNSARPTALST